MSTSMVTTVLQIEREAQSKVDKAGKDAEAILADAQLQRSAAAKAAADAMREEVAALERRAAAERAKKAEEVQAVGNAELAKVQNVSDAVFDKGVRYVLEALAGK